ncbi:MAG: T9SS type A sorting domain-containing protein [Aureispira sp.]|nr:T9SS type A sorting domain-containing protein [Aureispira sp.]
MKLILKILLLQCCVSFVYAQEGINTGGGHVSTPEGTVSFSLGQVVYTTTSGEEGAISLGIQQGIEIEQLNTISNDLDLDLIVYPNPTSDQLILNITQAFFEKLEYRVLDSNAKLILTNKIKNNKTSINMEEFPSSRYILTVQDNKGAIQSFQIIKK